MPRSNPAQSIIKVTVCQLRDDPDGLAEDWERLVAHVKSENSQLVLLPEMPFSSWFARVQDFDPDVWQAAVTAHQDWQKRFNELAPAIVIGSQPVDSGYIRLNEGFIWTHEHGYQAVHHKYYLPDEEGFWEASWYQRGEGEFRPVTINHISLGFLICTELWFFEQARAYGKAAAQLIVTPRTTGTPSVDKWLVGGRSAAIVSGAFSLSSNRASRYGQAAEFGGQGWVVGPDGQILGLTSSMQPFVTVEIDLSEAERAKLTYPRYVLE
jgi:predicted amidohydrolase